MSSIPPLPLLQPPPKATPTTDPLQTTEMPTPGYVFKDGGPIPDADLHEPRQPTDLGTGTAHDHLQETASRAPSSATTSSSTAAAINTPTSGSSSEPPSDSHALATASHEVQGAVQRNSTDGEVRDMGFQTSPVPRGLVGGLSNEDLWTLVRRFNKQMYHVKATSRPLLGGLDCNIVDEDEFSPDKLRANVERLYMTVIIGLMGVGNHVVRLRSWRERRRTGAFCAAYAVAWIFNAVFPLILTTAVVLIVFPPSRAFLFPPAPLALVDSKTGGVKSPPADSGVLGSHDSATGAPEKHKGEAVEQEAHNFVTGIGSIALSSAAGKHEPGDPETDDLNKTVPDPTNVATVGAEAKAAAAGGQPNTTHDKTKQPMEQAMWTKMRPVMHVIGDIADGWERFGNVLSPTPPFPQDGPRLKLAAILVPLVAVSFLTTSEMAVRGASAAFGIGFFTDPLVWRGLDYLNKNYPNWQKLLELRNSILKGVPTNAQLTITLLRIGEANKAPIPPPPRSDAPPPSRPASIHEDDIAASNLDASHEEIQEAIHKDPNASAESEELEKKKQHHHGERIVSFFRGTTKTGVDTKFGIDKVRAKIGSEAAKNTLGVIPKDNKIEPMGPVDFKGRYHGSKGWIYISTNVPTPTVSFSYNSSDGTGHEPENKNAKFSVPIQDIREIKKVGGLGWKTKIVVGWATGKTVADGLEIVDCKGDTYKVTAVRLREELFNRLVAMGGQKWDCL